MCEIAVGCMFRNNAPYFKEWIDYHLMIGVERFYLADDRSTDNWREILEPYIERGFVVITHVWVEETAWYPKRQMDTFNEIAETYKDSTTWMAFLDTDEFVVPVNYKSLRDCLRAHYSDASAVYMTWRNFGTSYLTEHQTTILDKLTRSSVVEHSRNSSGKTIYRTCDAMLSNFWSQHFVPLERGYYFDGDGIKNTHYQPGGDVYVDGESRHKNAVLYIHHYTHKDETYFMNNRLKREDIEVLVEMEHHISYNTEKNVSMMTYIQKYHPESTLWATAIPTQDYIPMSDTFRQICADNKLFDSFKRNADVRVIMEHLDHGNGVIYKQLCEKHISTEQLTELVELNDRYGMPYTYMTDGILGSASSFRNIFHAIEILQLYTSSIPMVEIGGGYGGLCLIIHKLAEMLNVSIPMYHICDLPNANALQELYLSKHSLTFSPIFPLVPAFVISNYALSEIPLDIANQYIDQVIPVMNGGYFAWNTDSDTSWIPSTSVEITEEYPQTGNINKIIKCKMVCD